MSLGESVGYLRHLLVVDHQQKAIVLSLRGTTTLSSAITDVLAFSEDFCGGQAHSGMAQVARNTWMRLKCHVYKAMEEYPDYALVTTGHSLGGGVATLVNIMLYHDNFMPNRSKQCIAFAPPPSFYPLEAASRAIANTTVYVHNYDIVSSISVDSLRRTMKVIRAVDQYTKNASLSEKLKLQTGRVEPPERLVRLIELAKTSSLNKIKGAPELMIPAQMVVWLEHMTDGSYATLFIDPRKYSKRLLDLDPFMVDDHFLTKYDAALEKLRVQQGSTASFTSLIRDYDGMKLQLCTSV
jgi:hypothetical protein